MARQRILTNLGGYQANDLSSSDNVGNWHPTVSFLIGIILLEYAALLGMRYFFRTVHGG